MEDRYFEALNRVLDAWPHSPESLGETIEEATMRVYPWEEDRHAKLRRVARARKLLYELGGGRELVELERKLNASYQRREARYRETQARLVG